MGNKLVLIGGGGHCKSVLDSAIRMKTFEFEKIVITDPTIPSGTFIMGCEVVGTDDCLGDLHNDGFEYAFITVGSVRTNPLREKLAKKVEAIGFKYPIIIDSSAIVAESSVIGRGSFIGKNVIVNADTKIGQHCIINTGSIIEHECVIDDYAHISVGSIVCGEVTVGRNSFIGAGSTVIQCLHIGDNVVIGANSTVLADVEDNMKYYGIVTNRGGV